ncbi:MAG: AAA family ATPase, partial [Thermoanaerobaculia bacterium]
QVMLKKLGIKTSVARVSEVASDEHLLGLSGSDLESVLVRAVLEAEAADAHEVAAEHLKKAFEDFLPSSNSREREMQILCAVLESTSRELLPERYRKMDRGDIQARISEIKRELRLSS